MKAWSLKEVRVARGYSVRELATAADLNEGTISAIENGKRRSPHPDTIRRLCRLLEVHPADVIEFADALAAINSIARVPRVPRRPAAGTGTARAAASRSPYTEFLEGGPVPSTDTEFPEMLPALKAKERVASPPSTTQENGTHDDTLTLDPVDALVPETA